MASNGLLDFSASLQGPTPNPRIDPQAPLAKCCPRQLHIYCFNASDFAMGGILSQQQPNETWRPVAFILKSFNSAE